MTEQQLAAMEQALEALEAAAFSFRNVDAITALRTAIEQAKRQQALDKMAENERELGIQMQPEPVAFNRKAVWNILFEVWNQNISANEGLQKLQDLYTHPAPAADHTPDAGKMVGPCKYPKCPYPCPDLPDCKDAEKQQAPAAVVNQQLTTEAAAPVQEPVQYPFKHGSRKIACKGHAAGLLKGLANWMRRDQVGDFELLELVAEYVDALEANPSTAQRQWIGLKDESVVSAAARVLSDRVAALCDVDCGDHWMLYGNDYIEDARAALEAAEAKLREKNGGAS